MSQQVGDPRVLPNSSGDRPRAGRADNVAIRRRLVQSAWSVAASVLILLMLGSLAVLMVSSAPLWMWAAPEAPGNNESLPDPAADGFPSVLPE
jgi:hypothetical protein